MALLLGSNDFVCWVPFWPAVQEVHSSRQSMVRHTASSAEWQEPSSAAYNGLLLHRPLPEPLCEELQKYVDALAESCRLGPGMALREVVPLADGTGAALHPQGPPFHDALSHTLAHVMATISPPRELELLIDSDARTLVGAYQEMFPDLEEVELGVELMGENACSRWHQDYIACRCIVSYNLAATEYVLDAGVDFRQLEDDGNNDLVVKDPSMVRRAAIGDLLLIKGRRFPHGAKALVHRSPGKRYYSTGHVMHRLILKVDVKGAEGADE